MKITDISIHVLKSPLSEPFAFSQGWVRQRSATLVEVLTDEGISGWGEAFAQGLEPPEIAATVVDKALRPLVVGADPLDTEVLWHRMYHMTRDYGRKGSVVAGISAVDIALWDIAGKFHKVPVYKLLGGAFRTRVQPYATGFYRIQGQGEAKRLAEEAIRHFEAGFALMKVKLGYGVDRPPLGGPGWMLVHGGSLLHRQLARRSGSGLRSRPSSEGWHEHLRCWGPIAQRGMRPDRVVVTSPTLDDHLRLLE